MTETETTCKAIMEQKDAKGKQCWRQQKENGYCGIHQKHALIQTHILQNKQKCLTYRCLNFLEEITNQKYCDLCQTQKDKALQDVQICKALIEQGPTKGTRCKRPAKLSSDYCGKHIERQTNVIEAEKQKLRICDDGKRACKQFTTDQNLLCDECLKKCREYDNKQYNTRKDLKNVCVTCGIQIESMIIGENDEHIQKCQLCYHKMKDIEKKRVREERNYNVERKKNTEKHFNEYKKGASQRNLWFELSHDEFKTIVEQPCFYCETYNMNEVIGIDRLYSDLGYCLQNCVPCCKICNIMKNDMTPTEFINHLQKFTNQPLKLVQTIQRRLLDTQTIQILKQSHQSYVRPSMLVIIVKSQSLDSYIDICKQERRSEDYIKNIRSLSQYQTRSKPFIRNEIRKIFQH